jgi:hypothetical protein
MRVKILQPFTCSRDGGSVDLKAGQEADIFGDALLRALEDGGYIRAIASETTLAAIAELERGDGKRVETVDALMVALNDDAAEELEAIDDVDNAAPENLTVKHIGHGRYAVHKGDERVTDPMTKEDAEAALAGML